MKRANRETVEKIAEEYGVHPETIRRWFRSGKLIGKRIGKRWYFLTAYAHPSEEFVQSILGKEAKYQSPGSSFDFLYNNRRIEVKSSEMRRNSSGYYWTFLIDKSFKHADPYCDEFILVCYDNNGKIVLRAYQIPYNKLHMTSHSTFRLSVSDESLEKYRIIPIGRLS